MPETRGKRRMTASWGPLIGEGFCREYYPVRLFLVRSALALPTEFILLAIAIPALTGSSPVALLSVALLVVVPGFVALGVAVHRLQVLGRRFASDLNQAGYPSDRRAPLRSTHLFEEWRVRNSIPTKAVIGVGNRKYGGSESF
ncbi:MAG: hypothetical protein LH624_07000 [Cryobacterium sp.]|nr:hypothetical protein [Cryobacterium sp.]